MEAEELFIGSTDLETIKRLQLLARADEKYRNIILILSN